MISDHLGIILFKILKNLKIHENHPWNHLPGPENAGDVSRLGGPHALWWVAWGLSGVGGSWCEALSFRSASRGPLRAKPGGPPLRGWWAPLDPSNSGSNSCFESMSDFHYHHFWCSIRWCSQFFRGPRDILEHLQLLAPFWGHFLKKSWKHNQEAPGATKINFKWF